MFVQRLMGQRATAKLIPQARLLTAMPLRSYFKDDVLMPRE